jgi:hypothetical protein
VCIDDTQGFDGVRYYKGYTPTIRSQRNGLKVAVLKYQRTDFAKKIRKDYEAGRIKERRCNMRECTTRDDGRCNTLTTLQKDNYVIEYPIGAAMRGRYDENGCVEQQIEPRFDGLSNCITSVQKDSLVIEDAE